MIRKRIKKAAFALLAVVLAGLAVRAYRSGGDRRLVLAASPEELRKWGRHFLVGFDRFEEVEDLVKRGAIGGVLLRAKNVRGKSVAEIGAEIAKLQEIQKIHGLPPLFVAADQEGGPISRMSPPLPALPSLGVLLREADAAEVEILSESYAEWQGSGLARLGVNLNFAPVVDVNGTERPSTPISYRTLGDDPEIVRRAAAAYAAGLRKYGVLPTLKHFPGLGRFREDTHWEEPMWRGPLADFEDRDWIPYGLPEGAPCALMLGHVRLTRIDPDFPVSLSKKVIQGLIRKRWGEDVLLITDDVEMAPIRLRKEGVGGAAVEALNAGADLVLTANGLDAYWTGMRAVLEANRESRMDEALIKASLRRRERLFLRNEPLHPLRLRRFPLLP